MILWKCNIMCFTDAKRTIPHNIQNSLVAHLWYFQEKLLIMTWVSFQKKKKSRNKYLSLRIILNYKLKIKSQLSVWSPYHFAKVRYSRKGSYHLFCWTSGTLHTNLFFKEDAKNHDFEAKMKTCKTIDMHFVCILLLVHSMFHLNRYFIENLELKNRQHSFCVLSTEEKNIGIFSCQGNFSSSSEAIEQAFLLNEWMKE